LGHLESLLFFLLHHHHHHHECWYYFPINLLPLKSKLSCTFEPWLFLHKLLSKVVSLILLERTLELMSNIDNQMIALERQVQIHPWSTWAAKRAKIQRILNLLTPMLVIQLVDLFDIPCHTRDHGYGYQYCADNDFVTYSCFQSLLEKKQYHTNE
jgi:hypothetical protein